MEGAAVLVVEDDADLRGAVARGLREARPDGDDGRRRRGALAALGPGPARPFDAVVLDIGLPDSDGRDVCQALRARGIDARCCSSPPATSCTTSCPASPPAATTTWPSPSTSAELLARLRAMLRRAPPRAGSRPTGLPLDPAAHALAGPAGASG